MTKLPMLGSRIPTMDTRIVPRAPKVADTYYNSPEHKAWAAEVIRRAAGRCQDPECKAKHWPGMRLYADHILERRDRPDLALDITNGRATCAPAHTRKTLAERAKRMKA